VILNDKFLGCFLAGGCFAMQRSVRHDHGSSLPTLFRGTQIGTEAASIGGKEGGANMKRTESLNT
jgi:hypothetical protein